MSPTIMKTQSVLQVTNSANARSAFVGGFMVVVTRARILLPCHHLIMAPLVGLHHAFFQWNCRFTFTQAHYKGVVDVPASDLSGDVQPAGSRQSYSANFNHAAAVHDGLDNLAAYCCWSFFSTSLKGLERTVPIVQPHYSGDHTKILPVVAAHGFTEKLIPAIAVFWLGRVSVFLLKSNDSRIRLLVSVIITTRRSAKVSLNLAFRLASNSLVLISTLCMQTALLVL